MTRDQYQINLAYAKLHEALNAICQVYDKDVHLINVQHQMYVMEDTLYQYLTKEDRKHGQHF